MSFPVSIDKNAPATTDTPLPTQISQIGGWLEDLFGLPNATNILGAILSLGTLTDGKVATDTVVKASTPFKRLIGTEGSAKDFRLAESAGLILLQVNTATEAAPTWVTVYSFNFGANFAAQFIHTLTANRLLTIPDFAGTLALFSAVGAFQARFSQANTATRTYTFPDQDMTLAPVVYTDELTGLGLSNNGADAVNDLDVAVGAAASDDAVIANRVLLSLTTALTKQIDAVWAAGTNAGMRDPADDLTGAKTFHVWLFRRTAGGIDIFCSTSVSPPIPDSGDKKRILGSLTWSGTAIGTFVQDADFFQLASPVLDVDATNPGTAAVTATLASIPNGRSLLALINVVLRYDNAAPLHVLISDLATTDVVPSFTASPGATFSIYAGSTEVRGGGEKLVRTNTARQIRYRLSASAASAVVRLSSVGWFDRRGRG